MIDPFSVIEQNYLLSSNPLITFIFSLNSIFFTRKNDDLVLSSVCSLRFFIVFEHISSRGGLDGSNGTRHLPFDSFNFFG